MPPGIAGGKVVAARYWATMKWLRLVALGLSAWLSACQASPPIQPDTWQSVDTGCQQSLRGLAVVSADVAFVGGGGGTLLGTVDGGRSWRDIAPPGSEGCDFRDLQAFDRNHLVAMVAGQPARVYRTEDGGKNWRVVHEDPRPEAFFDAMAFGEQQGVLFGDAIDGEFCILFSEDQGRTWRDAPADRHVKPQGEEAGFAASGTCVASVATDRTVYSLVTGGASSRHIQFDPQLGGRTQDLPLQQGGPSQGAFSCAWSGLRAVVVGGDYQNPEVAKGTAALTLDGGKHWYPGNACGYRSAVIWLDDLALLAVGSHGASWSSDEGRTWTAFGGVGYHSLDKGNDGVVWACGSDGRVAKLRCAN